MLVLQARPVELLWDEVAVERMTGRSAVRRSRSDASRYDAAQETGATARQLGDLPRHPTRRQVRRSSRR